MCINVSEWTKNSRSSGPSNRRRSSTQSRLPRMRILCYTILFCRLLKYSNWSFRTTFFRPPGGLHVFINRSEVTFIAINRTFFILVFHTRRYLNLTTSYCNFHIDTNSDWLSRVGTFLFVAFLHQSVCLWVGCRRKQLCFGSVSMCLPLKTLYQFPLNIGFVPNLPLGDWTPCHNIIPDFELPILIIRWIWSFTAVFNTW